MDNAPFFMTHHGPVAAWSSMTFGMPGMGMGIETERVSVEDTGDLWVGVSRGAGRVSILPFCRGGETDLEQRNLGGTTPGSDAWRRIDPAAITRRLSACRDEYRAEDLTFTVTTPYPALPDPQEDATTEADLRFALCPGILLEVTLDNTAHPEDALVFLGMLSRRDGKILPLDWCTAGRLCGLVYKNEWAIGACAEAGRVFTIRDNTIAAPIERMVPLIHAGGNEGAIGMRVPAGERATLRCALGFFKGGAVTQGVPGSYAYTERFHDPADACAFVLEHADRFHEAATALDSEIAARCPDPTRRLLLAQSIRGYYANTQLVRTPRGLRFNVSEGQFSWRNTLDLAADHAPFEAWRNPWVIRNIMDVYIDEYSYTDRVLFPDDPTPHPGGLAFCHDQGPYTAFSPIGTSGYELTGHPFYSFMTTEQVLNGIYCIATAILGGGLTTWGGTCLDTLNALLVSLENRDHPDPARRDGLLMGETDRVGTSHEITTYDALDPSLKSARGNLYIAVKTWGATLLLDAVFERLGFCAQATRAGAMAQKTAAALTAWYDETTACFPANRLQPGASRMIAALEPLAVPLYCGLEARLRSWPDLLAKLEAHSRTCLQRGACLEDKRGGLLLVSTSFNSWPSKGFLCAFVLEDLFGIDLDAAYPTIMQEFRRWFQDLAAKVTLTDQMHVDKDVAHGGHYYPRMVTASLWAHPRSPRLLD